MATQVYPGHRIPHTPWPKPRSCWTANGSAKRRYTTRSEAKRAAKWMERHHREGMDTYWCDGCQAYHVGHKRQEPEVAS